MNTVQKLLATTLLALPIAGIGCSKKSEEAPKSKLDENYPLNSQKLREAVPGIHLFAQEGDDYLTSEDVEVFVKLRIDNGDGKLSNEEVDEILKTRNKLAKAALHTKYWHGRESYYAPNIDTTLKSFKEVYQKYCNEEIRQKEKKEKLEQLESEIAKKLAEYRASQQKK